MKTQHDKILEHMASDPARWWLPQDFMRPELGQLFVGYEASARLSELAKLYPDKIESQRQGKYMARRLKIQAPKPQLAPASVSQNNQQAKLFDLPAAAPKRQML